MPPRAAAMKPTPFNDTPRSPLVRPPMPLKRWVLGIVLLALGGALGVGCYFAARYGSGRLAFRLGEFALLLFINGVGITGYAAATRRAAKRFEAGLCPKCGFNLGGKFDAPCPRCYPEGDPNFISPAASNEEFQAWLQRQPREQRRHFTESRYEVRHRELTLQPRLRFRLAPIAIDGGGTSFLDAARVSMLIYIPLIALTIGAAAAFVSIGIFVVVAAGAASFAIPAGIALAILPSCGMVWVFLRVRDYRGRARVVTFWREEGIVTDQLTRHGRHLDQRDGPLSGAYITLSDVSGFPGDRTKRVGIVLWAPRGPLLLACESDDKKLDAYLATLPDWLRATERTDPAHIVIKSRPRRATA